ncbi:hypothetical protein RHS01_04474 [Rhizoctonia solani]|uniref:Uncharacterized protein n=1 Tax=Rhizoctonia solani TaxID=456999 RepID=A0A8H7ID61_9AGAM|nr:hypothetical protein RHS01_04474 [Rhizoctonia solani]
MGRLHMKETPAEREEQEERAQEKAVPFPSRRNKKRHESIPPFDEYIEEDSRAPPASATKVDMDALRAEMEEREFREKLFDAMGMMLVERPTSSHLRDDPSMMDDDQYAEWIREGMWRRTHKAEVEAQERAEEERKRKKEREKARREETRRMEREDSERRSRRKHAKEGVSPLLWGFRSPVALSPSASTTSDSDALSKQTVSAFLLSPLHSIGKPGNNVCARRYCCIIRIVSSQVDGSR